MFKLATIMGEFDSLVFNLLMSASDCVVLRIGGRGGCLEASVRARPSLAWGACRARSPLGDAGAATWCCVARTMWCGGIAIKLKTRSVSICAASQYCVCCSFVSFTFIAELLNFIYLLLFALCNSVVSPAFSANMGEYAGLV